VSGAIENSRRLERLLDARATVPDGSREFALRGLQRDTREERQAQFSMRLMAMSAVALKEKFGASWMTRGPSTAPRARGSSRAWNCTDGDVRTSTSKVGVALMPNESRNTCRRTSASTPAVPTWTEADPPSGAFAGRMFRAETRSEGPVSPQPTPKETGWPTTTGKVHVTRPPVAPTVPGNQGMRRMTSEIALATLAWRVLSKVANQSPCSMARSSALCAVKPPPAS